MISLGFRARETMFGSYYLLANPEEDCEVTLSTLAEARSLPTLFREKKLRLSGEITLSGFAEKRPIEGMLYFNIPGDFRLVYDFSFSNDEGKLFTFRGENDLMIISPISSITTIPSSIYDAEGDEFGRAILRLDEKAGLLGVIRSFRFW